MEASNVIDRLKEQLKLAGKVHGFKKAVYRELPDGTQELVSYARQHIKVQCADILELIGVIDNQEDPIVKAQKKGHTAAMGTFDQQHANMLADDVFHLIQLAEKSKAASPA